ncbi:hypothetical protein ACJ73_07042 [Blastomyces percursus]|uniref:Prokaryotic-type class I peptide chain release factors domain-containing protein n=1 Tax=Blastomyces percursus TaxID=1658174 RepID=A0A1J9QZH4_9EURO|nr:hypothetical protein ACJ73_07042 [Blastomyces percursus]
MENKTSRAATKWHTEAVLALLPAAREANATPPQARPGRSHRQLSEGNRPRRTGYYEIDVLAPISYRLQSEISVYLLNKTNSAVQLIHKPTGIVVKSQATRSRTRNQKIAMGILAEKVELQLKGEKSRAAIKAETKRKRKASMEKKAKRKYRKLEEEKRMRGLRAEGEKEGEEEEGNGEGEVELTESDAVDEAQGETGAEEGVISDKEGCSIGKQMDREGSRNFESGR